MTPLASSADVADLAAGARGAGRLGIDTEFMGEGRYRALLCLVQVAVETRRRASWSRSSTRSTTPFDPAPLAAVLADPEIEVVLHAGAPGRRAAAPRVAHRASATSSTRRSPPASPACAPSSATRRCLPSCSACGCVGEHTCIVALGIDIDGVKHPLSLVEGSTENTTLVTDLIVGLRERGLNVTRPILAVLDGAKALRRAVREVFDHPVIGRCQLHKIRNVQDRLPEKLRGLAGQRMRQAYHADSALAAQALLERLAAELDKTHPGAAGQPARGDGRDLDRAPARGAAHPGPDPAQHERGRESMISISRDHSRNVKRWRDGQMALRWCAAGMVEAGKQFRRVNGHLHLPALRDRWTGHRNRHRHLP